MKINHIYTFCTIIALMLCSFSEQAFAADYTVSGGIGTPYADRVNSSGVETIYIFNTLTNASLTYESNAASVLFYKYTQSLSDTQLVSSSDITTVSSGGITTYTVHNLEDSKGYYAMENGGQKSVIWIIDYTQHQPMLTSIEPSEADDRCYDIKLIIDKSDELYYYGTNGSKREIDRKYTLEYANLKWDDSQKSFIPKTVRDEDIIIGTEYVISAPLQDTQFKLSGDHYASLIGLSPQSVVSAQYKAVATEVHIEAVLDTLNTTSNVSKTGDPAPANYSFYGHANSPTAVYTTWYIYNKKDLVNYIIRYTDKDISYTFDLEGDYRIIFEVANDNLDFPCISKDSIDISISETYIAAPNFFSPKDSPGQNDEFKVAYRSIRDFKCAIFNRWGNKLYEWTDPSKGWDGKYSGKYVSPGVYFYVIEYRDSKGEKKHLKGDINIIRSK